MNTKKYGPWIVALLIGAPFVYSGLIYPQLPSQIPTHFNIEGKPDAWGGPDSIFIGPGIMGAVSLFVYVLMVNLKSIDPKKYDDKNDTLYQNFALLTVAFLSIIKLHHHLYFHTCRSSECWQFNITTSRIIFCWIRLVYAKV